MRSSKGLFNCGGSNELPRVTKILKILFGEENYSQIILETYIKFAEELRIDETHKEMMEEYTKIWQEVFVVDPKLGHKLDDLKGNLGNMENIFFLEKGFEMGQKQSQMIESHCFSCRRVK